MNNANLLFLLSIFIAFWVGYMYGSSKDVIIGLAIWIIVWTLIVALDLYSKWN